MEKVGFFEDSNGNQSFTRLSIAWYFWTICLFGSLWVLYIFGDAISKGTLTISDGGMILGMFVILQLGWIAPKQLSKISEIKELIAEVKK